MNFCFTFLFYDIDFTSLFSDDSWFMQRFVMIQIRVEIISVTVDNTALE